MIKINKPKTFLPLSIAKGTTEERLAKATQSNLKFYKDLSYDFKDREVGLPTFKRSLREATGNRINIQTFANEEDLTTSVSSSYWGKTNKYSGYTLKLPVRLWTDKVQQRTAPLFLNETQNFFSYIFNPKFVYEEVIHLGINEDIKKAIEKIPECEYISVYNGYGLMLNK